MATDLPDILARAEAQAARRAPRALAAEEVEGLRRAVRRELDGEGLVVAKALADGAAGPAERRLLAAALVRLAGLYEAAAHARSSGGALREAGAAVSPLGREAGSPGTAGVPPAPAVPAEKDLPPGGDVPPGSPFPPEGEVPPERAVPPGAEVPRASRVPPEGQLPPETEVPPESEVPAEGEVPPASEVPPETAPPPGTEPPTEQEARRAREAPSRPDPVALAAHRLAAAVEARARGVEALLAGDVETAAAEVRRSTEALEASPLLAAAAVDPPALIDVAGRVYDRSTGRSRYDPDEEGHLPFRLVCPRDVCGALHDARLLATHSTHRLTCPVCGADYLVYLAPVRAAIRQPGQGVAIHEIETRDTDGTVRTLRFEDPAGGRGPVFRPGYLLVAAYDGENRLRRVRAYGREAEVRVPAPARCFVATAASGPFAPEVVELRRLRDEVLVHRPAGRRFIRWYERRGPELAAWVARSPALRRAARAGLRAFTPVSAGLRLVLRRPPA